MKYILTFLLHSPFQVTYSHIFEGANNFAKQGAGLKEGVEIYQGQVVEMS